MVREVGEHLEAFERGEAAHAGTNSANVRLDVAHFAQDGDIRGPGKAHAESVGEVDALVAWVRERAVVPGRR